MSSLFKKELNWGTHQETQFKAIQSIEKALNKTLEMTVNQANMMSNTDANISAMLHATEISAQNIELMAREWTKDAVSFKSAMTESGASVRRFTADLGDSSDDLKGFSKDVKATGKETKGFGVSLKSVLSGLGSILTTAGKEVDKLSTASNQMIQFSGMNGEAVREFRSEVKNIVSGLNRETGYLYSPIDSYQKIVSWSESVTGNLDAITEMSRPLLLSYETLNVNVTSVAELFNRFYTRYSFTSSHMEEALDNIKNNTSGNSANAEATLKNIEVLKGFLEYNIKDPDELAARMEEVSNFTSYFESMGVDSGPFAELIKRIAWGDTNQDISVLLAHAGLDRSTAITKARTGEIDELAYSLMQGMYSAFSTWDGTANMIAPLKNLGLDEDLLLDVRNLIANGNYVTMEEFLESQENNTDKTRDMVESAEDMYVSVQQQIANRVEEIYFSLADIQERVGIGVSDIGVLLSSIANLMSNAFIGKKLFGKGGSAPTTPIDPSAPKTPFMESTLSGAALTIGGAAVAGQGIYLGVRDYNIAHDEASTDKEKEAASSGLNQALIGTAVAGGTVATGAGLASLAGVGAAAGPIGWAALAVGGVALLGKTIYDQMHSLTGSAQAVKAEMQQLGKSLEEENSQRVSEILDLKQRFILEDDLETQRQMLIEAGLAKESELQDMTATQMLAMIEEYKKAAVSMQSVTEGIMNQAERNATSVTEQQVNDFLVRLQQYDIDGEGAQEKLIAALNQLKYSDKTDADLANKISEKIADGYVDRLELNDIIYGGRDAAFDRNHLKAKRIDASAMINAADILEFDVEYRNINYTEATKLYSAYRTALTEDERESALEAIKNSGIPYEDMVTLFGDHMKGTDWEIPAYDEGINRVPEDQLAYLHEGEAVVPKKYNPAVNSYESRMLTEELRRSQEESTASTNSYLGEFIREIQEIKKFLSQWKIDNDRKDNFTYYKSKNPYSDRVQSYMSAE